MTSHDDRTCAELMLFVYSLQVFAPDGMDCYYAAFNSFSSCRLSDPLDLSLSAPGIAADRLSSSSLKRCCSDLQWGQFHQSLAAVLSSFFAASNVVTFPLRHHQLPRYALAPLHLRQSASICVLQPASRSAQKPACDGSSRVRFDADCLLRFRRPAFASSDLVRVLRPSFAGPRRCWLL